MRGSGTVRAERVCYSAQTPWVMGGTVRDNVLFGLPMVEERYRYAVVFKYMIKMYILVPKRVLLLLP